MRLLHTSDWHLGRQLHGSSLLAEQTHALEQIVILAREQAVDVVLISGDIYDRAIPSAEAVNLLGKTLRTLCVDVGCQVVAIAGNHDSPERLGFAAELLGGAGLHLIGPLTAGLAPITVTVDGSAYDIFALPYAGPLTVRQVLGGELSTHAQAMAALLEQVEMRRCSGRPTVVAAHCFVAGGEASESERPLSVGGAESVPANLFLPYTYVALGHLHRPQCCQVPYIRYSGSLLKYSFSEVSHQKSVTIVDIDPSGELEITEYPLRVLRDLRIIEGELEQLLADGAEDPGRDDYLLARLTDTQALLNVMGKLRQRYPNLLQVQLPAREGRVFETSNAQAMLRRSQLSIFTEFFEASHGEALTESQLDHLTQLLETLHEEGRL